MHQWLARFKFAFAGFRNLMDLAILLIVFGQLDLFFGLQNAQRLLLVGIVHRHFGRQTNASLHRVLARLIRRVLCRQTLAVDGRSISAVFERAASPFRHNRILDFVRCSRNGCEMCGKTGSRRFSSFGFGGRGFDRRIDFAVGCDGTVLRLTAEAIEYFRIR